MNVIHTVNSYAAKKKMNALNSLHGSQGHYAEWKYSILGFPWWLSDKESACQCKRQRFSPWSGKIPHGKAAEPVLKSLRSATAEPMYRSTKACMP